MATTITQKLKILYLYDILKQWTDDDHSITMEEILEGLASCDIHAERKAIYTDIQALNQYGADVIGEKIGKGFSYRLGSRDIELDDLKLIADAVSSSPYISSRKAKDLNKMLEGLASNYEAPELERNITVANRVKNMNESIFYNIDVIQQAMNNNLRITFKSQAAKSSKKSEFLVSPWELLLNDEGYFMIGYDGKIRRYRVDDMKQISLTDKKREGKTAYKNIQ